MIRCQGQGCPNQIGRGFVQSSCFRKVFVNRCRGDRHLAKAGRQEADNPGAIFRDTALREFQTLEVLLVGD